MDMIWMTHPQLPPDQVIYEPAASQVGHQQSGWVITDPPSPPEEG